MLWVADKIQYSRQRFVLFPSFCLFCNFSWTAAICKYRLYIAYQFWQLFESLAHRSIIIPRSSARSQQQHFFNFAVRSVKLAPVLTPAAICTWRLRRWLLRRLESTPTHAAHYPAVRGRRWSQPEVTHRWSKLVISWVIGVFSPHPALPVDLLNKLPSVMLFFFISFIKLAYFDWTPTVERSCVTASWCRVEANTLPLRVKHVRRFTCKWVTNCWTQRRRTCSPARCYDCARQPYGGCSGRWAADSVIGSDCLWATVFSVTSFAGKVVI